MPAPGTPSTLRRMPIGARPNADPASAWVQSAEGAHTASRASEFTARLTLDVTPALRGRIKVAAFQRGVTAAEMLRELLEQVFSEKAP